MSSINIIFLISLYSNITFGYYMVTTLGIKIKSVDLKTGYPLINMGIAVTFALFSILLLLTISWRLRSITTALKKSEDENSIKIIVKILSKIEDLIYSINSYLSLNYITSFSSTFIYLLMFTFLGYDILVHNLSVDDVIFFCAGASFTCFNSLMCSLVIFFSMRFDKTTKNLFKFFNQIQMKNSDQKIRKICFLANLQLGHSKKNLSCGLFDLNWHLIFTLMASFFSYLITMIQFDYMVTVRSDIMGDNSTVDFTLL